MQDNKEKQTDEKGPSLKERLQALQSSEDVPTVIYDYGIDYYVCPKEV